MDEVFINAVNDYYHIIEDACLILINYINESEQMNITNKRELLDYIYSHHIINKKICERTYYFHGVGCTVEVDGIPKIDWDFGYLHFWCGIDPFKMARTLNNTSGSGCKIWDGKDIFEQCEKYLKEDGRLYKYKNQYYFDWTQQSLKKESLQQKSLILESYDK